MYHLSHYPVLVFLIRSQFVPSSCLHRRVQHNSNTSSFTFLQLKFNQRPSTLMNGVQDWQSIHMTLFSWLKYILDRFVCTLFSCYFQFDNLVNESFLSAVYTEKQHPSTIKLNSTRKKLQVVEFLLWKVSIFVWYCLVWFDDHDGDRDCLVDMTVYVPRQSDILKKWKLDQE